MTKNDYEEQIRAAIEKGATFDSMRATLDENINNIAGQIVALRQQLSALKAWERAFYKFFNPEPILLSTENVLRQEPVNPFLTSSQLRIFMGKHKITSAAIARKTNFPYSQILKFRNGLMTIPREIAEFVDSYEKRQTHDTSYEAGVFEPHQRDRP